MRQLALMMAGLGLVAVLATGCQKARQPKTYAVVNTTRGDIVILLDTAEAPETVSVFVGFVRGQREYLDRKSKTGGYVQKPLYNGTSFYRVEPDRQVEGGDPNGEGDVGPGVRFADEISPRLRHDKPGVVGMVPYGQGSYGSQFYITLTPMPEFDGQRTIFGQVERGIEVVRVISQTPATDGKPGEPVKVNYVKLIEK